MGILEGASIYSFAFLSILVDVLVFGIAFIAGVKNRKIVLSNGNLAYRVGDFCCLGDDIKHEVNNLTSGNLFPEILFNFIENRLE